MKDHETVSTDTRYSVVDHDIASYELASATAITDLSELYVDRPVKASTSEYADLPEVRNLTWTDSYFDEDEDVVAVFDFDYEAMENFHTSVGWVVLGTSILYGPLFWLGMFGLAPCYLRKNMRWNARAQHIAITRDGIRFVRDRRPCCWGMPFSDQGKVSRTIPFDKITDCDLEEPAGNTCFFVPNVLFTVNIDTASSSTDGRKELRIAGLKDPHSFKKLVWAMKRAYDPAKSKGNVQSRISSDEEILTLLRGIRNELQDFHQDVRAKLQVVDESA